MQESPGPQKKQAEHDFEQAVRAIRSGGVIVYPTETVYGLGCDPSDSRAVDRVRSIKGRSAVVPMLAVTHDWDAVRDWFAETPPPLAALMRTEPPLAVTLVFPASASAPAGIVSAEGTIAVRRTSDRLAARLAAASGGALLSTSANRSGEPPASRFEDLDPDVLQAVDLAIDAGAPLAGKPSTVVGVRDGELVIFREGAVPREEVERVAGGG